MNTTPFSTLHFTSTTPSDGPRSDQDQLQVDATRRVRAAGRRALVLGGGGSAGNAWLIGVIAGLFDAGLDVTEADLIIGTSAGSTAAAQITSASPTQLLADILSAAPQQRTGPVGSDGGRVPIGPVADHMRRTSEIIAAAEDAADMRRRLGAAALEMDAASDGSGQTRWRATVAARLPSQRWPERTVLIVAVDAHTGEPVVFDRHSGVDLVDAVAASCANGFGVPPYSIGDSRYIDGGYRRSSENADLAAGYGRVLVLSPLGGRTRAPLDWGMHLAAQVDELRARGSRVETVLPDSDSRDAFGSNLMDLSTRRPPLEPVTTKAEPLPSSSPNSGADALDISRLGRHDDTCSCSEGGGGEMSRAPSCPPTWARSAVLTNSACRSWVNGSSRSCGVGLPDRRDRRVRPVVSPLRMRGRAARQRNPAAGARTAGVEPDDVADHDPPLSLHRLWACVAPGHQPGRRAAGDPRLHPRLR